MGNDIAYNIGYYMGAPLFIGLIVWLVLRGIHARRGSERLADTRTRDALTAGGVVAFVALLSLIRLVLPGAAAARSPASASSTPAQKAVCADVQTLMDRGAVKDTPGVQAALKEMFSDARVSGDTLMVAQARDAATAQKAADRPGFATALDEMVSRCAALGQPIS